MPPTPGVKSANSRQKPAPTIITSAPLTFADESLLRERDEKIIDSICDIAGIAQEKRKTLIRLSDEIVRERHSDGVENRPHFQESIRRTTRGSRSIGLTTEKVLHLNDACGDWLHALEFFRKPASRISQPTSEFLIP